MFENNFVTLRANELIMFENLYCTFLPSLNFGGLLSCDRLAPSGVYVLCSFFRRASGLAYASCPDAGRLQITFPPALRVVATGRCVSRDTNHVTRDNWLLKGNFISLCNTFCSFCWTSELRDYNNVTSMAGQSDNLFLNAEVQRVFVGRQITF